MVFWLVSDDAAGWNSGCDEQTSPLENEQSRAGVRDDISWEDIDQDRAGFRV